MKNIIYTSQTRLNFDIDHLINMGIDIAYVSPYNANNEVLLPSQIIFQNLEILAQKAELASKRGLKVYPFFITINHPEGNFEIPAAYRRQQNIDGSERSDFICFRDRRRQDEMISYAAKSAQLGFERLAFDDDLRDAFCYCDAHLKGFEPFNKMTRPQIEMILNSPIDHPEHEQLRLAWYQYKYAGLKEYATRLAKTVHDINPYCRIGICNSAKRCQDFSGRNPSQWLDLFSTDTAPAFIRLCGECYDDNLMHLIQSTGWHNYFNSVFKHVEERMLEITYVTSIGYRSPGNIAAETKSVFAATKNPRVHWCWTEDFPAIGLDSEVKTLKNDLNDLNEKLGSESDSPLCLFIGHDLGAYTPINVTTRYGASHDPIATYNMVSLLGIPITMRSEIKSTDTCVICSSYISREMATQIDQHVCRGGKVILDSVAARCYRIYGGSIEFQIKGPVPSQAFEKLHDGSNSTLIAQCPKDSIYLIDSQNGIDLWTAYDIFSKQTGATCSAFNYGNGQLIVLGYDLSLAARALATLQWRKNLIKLFEYAHVAIPAFWTADLAVQCFMYDKQVVLVNWNSNRVSGGLNWNNNMIDINLEPHEIRVISTP
ncbi:MAG: hypothetical protein A2007_01665 [Verrucomicrobia bacterium GWC2_42_7]|nr:MAG: hypothetical protein A2007_01665 [Verrucomicrobia bacterium GWC2_42_7]